MKIRNSLIQLATSGEMRQKGLDETRLLLAIFKKNNNSSLMLQFISYFRM